MPLIHPAAHGRRFHAAAIAAALSIFLGAGRTAPAEEYLNADALKTRLERSASSHRDIVRFSAAANSPQGREIWLVEIGAGDDEERAVRPALLLVAGIEGNDLAGTSAAVAWIERLADGYAGDEDIAKIVDSTTIYIFPRLDPDGAEKFFATPQAESATGATPVDDDHDGIADEDGPDDLNGDGLITWMRIEDAEGEYIADEDEPRLLVKAEAAKGQSGRYRYLAEGVDDDEDERWNEDAVGGVNLNRNFPYNYTWFASDAGLHQVSETATRALADFAAGHPNIGIVFAFGAEDNLLAAPSAESGGGAPQATPGRRPRGVPPTGVQQSDLPYYEHLGEIYRRTIGLDKELKAVSQGGTFAGWMYFHRGRLALAAQAWSPEMQVALSKDEDSGEGEEQAQSEEEQADAPAQRTQRGAKGRGGRPGGKGPGGPGRGGSSGAPGRSGGSDPAPSENAEGDKAFLKWIDENAPELFVPWTEVEHPDFPGQKVEVGGFAPYAKINPPESLLDSLVTRHGDFLTTLSRQLPRVGIREMESKHLGKSVHEVTIQVENTGYLPTAMAQGERTREVRPTWLTLDLDDGAFLSGAKRTRLSSIEGSGGMIETRFILHCPDRKSIRVRVTSDLGGSAEATLDLEAGE